MDGYLGSHLGDSDYGGLIVSAAIYSRMADQRLGFWSVFDGMVAKQDHCLAQFDPDDWVLLDRLCCRRTDLVCCLARGHVSCRGYVE